MLSRKKLISIASLIGLIAGHLTLGDWRENAVMIDISGGENHTLVLTTNRQTWACGPNGNYPYNSFYGVLGTDSSQYDLVEKTLVRVHDGAMSTPSDYLEDMNDIDAGWMHSLALDVSGLVWAWGWNGEGQLGVGDQAPRTSPVQVHGVSDVGFLESITAISAGRSGRQSLAVDANNLAYAWGHNVYGQCGNGESDTNELTPVRVLSGEQDPNNAGTVLQYVVAVSAGRAAARSKGAAACISAAASP